MLPSITPVVIRDALTLALELGQKYATQNYPSQGTPICKLHGPRIKLRTSASGAIPAALPNPTLPPTAPSLQRCPTQHFPLQRRPCSAAQPNTAPYSAVPTAPALSCAILAALSLQRCRTSSPQDLGPSLPNAVSVALSFLCVAAVEVSSKGYPHTAQTKVLLDPNPLHPAAMKVTLGA